MIAPLARAAFASARGARARWAPAAAWAGGSIVAAALLRARPGGLDLALRGFFGAAGLPLLALACVGVVCAPAPAEAARPLVLLGAPPRRAAATLAAAAVFLAAVASGGVAALVVAIAHGPGDPPLGGDLLSSAGVAALAGGAYAAYFALGAALLGATGRGAAFIIDLVAGGLGAASLLTPRAHLRALLGGELAAHAPPRASSIALAVMVGVFLALVAARGRPR